MKGIVQVEEVKVDLKDEVVLEYGRINKKPKEACLICDI